MNTNNNNNIIEKIIDCFGEDIIGSSVNKDYEVGLNYIL
jgi:hypothetical protein